jgi:hypothetical protein
MTIAFYHFRQCQCYKRSFIHHFEALAHPEIVCAIAFPQWILPETYSRQRPIIVLKLLLSAHGSFTLFGGSFERR